MLFWHKHNIERSLTDLANFTPFPGEYNAATQKNQPLFSTKLFTLDFPYIHLYPPSTLFLLLQNANVIHLTFVSDEWSMEDKVLFEQAFNSHGKSFKKLQATVSNFHLIDIDKLVLGTNITKLHCVCESQS